MIEYPIDPAVLEQVLLLEDRELEYLYEEDDDDEICDLLVWE